MSELSPGSVVDGRYTVERLLGRGGMAAVYRVRHRTLGSFHALKVLELDRPSVRDRLVREGIVQSRLRHPNLVAVTDALDIDGRAALVMEYVHGPSLAAVLEEEGPLDVPRIDAIATALFDGLEAAHRQGIVHRDLKPHNVLLAIEGEEVVAKIADFGLVKILDDEGPSKTRTGAVFGTPEYMAPEQMRDARSVDTRADLFSLGAVLYELVSGESPFAGDDVVEILTKVSAGERRPLREVAPHAPERMIDAVEAALRVDRDERPPTVAALRARWQPERAAPAWSRAALLALVAPLPEQPTRLGSAADLPRSSVTATDPQPVTHPTVDLPPLPSRASEVFDDARSRPPLALAAGVGLATALALGAAVAVAWWPDPPRPPAPEPAAPPVVAAVVAPAPEPAPVVALPEPRPAPRPAAARPAPVVAVAPEPPPPAPVVAPAPPAPPPLPPKVQVLGAESMTVVLRDRATGKHTAPADARPGTWEVVAFFTPNVPTVLKTIELSAGELVTIRCVAAQQRCLVSP